ncbi:hypothetical protein [Klebsiella sp. K-Nf6]|uniref:hypothetical protein n=1 Tax=Klebsiella sp. K-Nf6 TaxID=2054595 RepID=UPI000C2888E3|nr:hypothetical protein [Klebsiella sp. K-Nf6]PJR64973.1 hypothetical protein CWM61_08985 [Klebsiella sp. K-Nf6]
MATLSGGPRNQFINQPEAAIQALSRQKLTTVDGDVDGRIYPTDGTGICVAAPARQSRRFGVGHDE